jgi:aminoglycoside phosphotransferase (APT) family kinase protein
MIDAAILTGLRRAGLIGPGQPEVRALTGGVSCDVWRVEAGLRSIVVKRALPKLRVAADWFAPVDRTASEARWLRRARSIDARLAPEVLIELPEHHAFALAFIADAPVWKDELIAGRIEIAFAAAVGRDLARLHAATAGNPDDAAAFQTGMLFEALRIDPFLRYVAARHPDVAASLTAIAYRLAATKLALVHGDISPKNILVSAAGPVFLDAECAVYGDPAFDLAFCTTHLLLKAVWKRSAATKAAAAALVTAYRAGIVWEPHTALLTRAGALAAALLLARVDGKSPAPYLTDPADMAAVRHRARVQLQTPQPLDTIIADWRASP